MIGYSIPFRALSFITDDNERTKSGFILINGFYTDVMHYRVLSSTFLLIRKMFQDVNVNYMEKSELLKCSNC